MKKIQLLIVLLLAFAISGCSFQTGVSGDICAPGEILLNGKCLESAFNFFEEEEEEEDCEGYYNAWGDCIEEIVCEQGYVPDGYACVKEEIVEQAITVYFEKPSGWEDVRIYFYNTSTDNDVIWNESPSMTPWYGHPGWYYYEFEPEIQYARVIFRDSLDQQIPEINIEGMLVASDIWFYQDYYTYVTTNPFE